MLNCEPKMIRISLNIFSYCKIAFVNLRFEARTFPLSKTDFWNNPGYFTALRILVRLFSLAVAINI